MALSTRTESGTPKVAIMGSRRRYRFLHAPPPVSARMGNSTQHIKPPFPGATASQTSVYYWWWQFLRRHEGYRATCMAGGAGAYAGLYEDWGDVHQGSFEDWFSANGIYLFAEPKAVAVREMVPGEMASEPDQYVYVAVMRNAALTASVDRVRGLLKSRLTTSGGSRSLARYPVLGSPAIARLYTTLKVWDAHVRDPSMTKAELAIAADLIVGGQRCARVDQGAMTALVRRQWREEIAKRSTEYLKQARAIMRHVARTDRQAAHSRVERGRLSVFPAA